MKKPTLLFIRHGFSTSNGKNIFSGQHDNAQLTEEGKQQAVLAGTKMKQEKVHIDRIISSPLDRAQQTATLIAREIEFNVQAIEIEPRFMEFDMGEREGTSREGVTTAMLTTTPGAEDAPTFMRRVAEALDELKDCEGTILIVSHAGVGRIIRCYLEGIPPENFFDLPPYPNATLVELP
jgi:alpha-ribazole phosphatase